MLYVDINIDFHAARLNSLLEHNVIVKKKYTNIESFSLNENAQTLDLIKILPSFTSDIPIPNASFDTSEVEINATLEDSPNVSTIDTPTCSNLTHDCPSQPYSLTSLKQNYIDFCAHSMEVKEFLFREICFLKSKITSYEQQMDQIMSNFGNINYKTELELKVSLLEKENFELKGQLIDKMLIIKQLKTNSKSYSFTIMPLLRQIRSLHQPKPMITSTSIIMIITTRRTIVATASTTVTVKTRARTTATKITRSGIRKKNNNSTNGNAVSNEKLELQLQEIQKEEHSNFLNLKTYGSGQTKMIYHKEINEFINSTQIK